LILSFLLSMALEEVGCPAARFIGPMLGGIFFSLFGAEMRLPDSLFTFAKGFLGVRIAAALGPSFFGIVLDSWPYMLGGTLWAMLSACFLGIMLTRLGAMPGTTAIWGLSPGGASVMTLLSAEYGADMRVVAFMQYLRVVAVSLTAILVSRIWVGAFLSTPAGASFASWGVPLEDFALTAIVVLLGVYLGGKTRFPAGTLLLPLILSALLRNFLGTDITVPSLVLYPVFAIIGWRIGLGFSRGDLKRVFRKLHLILVAIFLMMLACALFAVLMSQMGGVAPLTSYLATSPGGLDAVTIIAAGTGAALPFIAAMQALRLIVVIIWGPSFAKLSMRISHAIKPRPSRKL
jgi:membrane AbrB-like protein